MQRNQFDWRTASIAHDLGIGITAQQTMRDNHLDKFRRGLQFVRIAGEKAGDGMTRIGSTAVARYAVNDEG